MVKRSVLARGWYPTEDISDRETLLMVGAWLYTLGKIYRRAHTRNEFLVNGGPQCRVMYQYWFITCNKWTTRGKMLVIGGKPRGVAWDIRGSSLFFLFHFSLNLKKKKNTTWWRGLGKDTHYKRMKKSPVKSHRREAPGGACVALPIAAVPGIGPYLPGAEGQGWGGEGTFVGTVSNRTRPLCGKNSPERKWKPVPDDQWRIFLGWKPVLSPCQEGLCLENRGPDSAAHKKRRLREGEWPGARRRVSSSSQIPSPSFLWCFSLRHRYCPGVYSITFSYLYAQVKIFFFKLRTNKGLDQNRYPEAIEGLENWCEEKEFEMV